MQCVIGTVACKVVTGIIIPIETCTHITMLVVIIAYSAVLIATLCTQEYDSRKISTPFKVKIYVFA